MSLLASVATGSYVPPTTITTILREAVYDTVTNSDPEATPVLDMFASSGGITSPVYQWIVDQLPGIVLNDTSGSVDVDGINIHGINEGFDNPSFGTAYPYTGQPQRLTNFIQMFAAKVGISDTLKRGSPVGVRDPYNWEKLKAGKVIKKAIERRFFDNASANASSQNGTSGDPRRMYRLFDFATTSATAGAGVPSAYLLNQVTANGSLTPAHIDQMMETIMTGTSGSAGADKTPNVLAMSLGVKFDLSLQLRQNAISGIGTPITGINVSNINASENKIIRNVDVYQGDAGEVNMVWSRQIPQSNATTGGGKVWALRTDQIQYGFYSPLEHIPLAKTGHNTKGILVTEVGFQFLNPRGSGVINGVTT